MEGEAEQALLGAGRDLAGEIEDHGAGAAVQADDAARLLEHPQCVGVAGRDADERRPVEAGRDPLDVERVRAAALTGGRHRLDVRERVPARPEGHRRDDRERGDGDGRCEDPEAHR